MNTKEFAKAWKSEMQYFLSDEYISQKASVLGVDEAEIKAYKPVLQEVLSDAFYTLLVGLDGAASIGGIQIMYRVLDENGVVIADGTGKLEAAAWDEFYGQNG